MCVWVPGRTYGDGFFFFAISCVLLLHCVWCWILFLLLFFILFFIALRRFLRKFFDDLQSQGLIKVMVWLWSGLCSPPQPPHPAHLHVLLVALIRCCFCRMCHLHYFTVLSMSETHAAISPPHVAHTISFPNTPSHTHPNHIQSRAMEIRCGAKKVGDVSKRYVHMLNATLCACTRVICAILELNQQADGVRVPDVLVPYMGGMTFIPFIRDLEGKPFNAAAAASAAAASAASIPATVAASAAPAAVAAVAVTSAGAGAAEPPLTPEAQELVARIAAQGESVRTLKTSKAADADVKSAVEQLQNLKIQYKDLTGKDFGAAGSSSSSKKDDKKKEKKAAAPAVGGAAAAQPVAAISNPPPAAPPSFSTIMKDGSVNLGKLNERLATFAFVGGYEATRDDVAVAKSLVGVVDGDDAAIAAAFVAWAASEAAATAASQTHVKRWIDFIAGQEAEDFAYWQ